jgi:hypothetical protein
LVACRAGDGGWQMLQTRWPLSVCQSPSRWTGWWQGGMLQTGWARSMLGLRGCPARRAPVIRDGISMFLGHCRIRVSAVPMSRSRGV